MTASHPESSASFVPSRNPWWQLPLPFDIVYLIIDDLVRQGAALANLRNLSATCSAFASFCRPLKFETVEVNISHGNDTFKPSPMHNFATLLNEVPDIVAYIKNLRLVDHMSSFNSLVWSSSGEEMDLCYILTRPYTKLKNLELDLHTRWSWVPSRIRPAFQACFTLPTLQELKIGRKLVVSEEFFCFFKNVLKLDVQGSSSDLLYSSQKTSFCSPNWLSFRDTSIEGSSTKYLFREQAGISLSHLKHLVAYTRSAHIGLLDIPLQRCSGTLTDLEIFISSSGEWHLPPLDLGSLQILKNLTLTTDLMPGGNAGRESLSRFMWLCTTLQSSAEPNQIENISIIMNTRNFDLVKSLPWNVYFDDAFGKLNKWSRLSKLSIHINNQNKEDVRRYKTGSIEEMIYPEMPFLMHMDVVRIYVSSETLEFWTM